MKLKNIQITNFRSVNDSTPFSVTQVTCLVGKNESGKTNILRCLERLNSTNSHVKREWTDELDWPRNADENADPNALILQLDWEIEAAEKRQIEEVFGAGFLPEVSIKCVVYFNAAINWEYKFDPSVFKTYLSNKFGLTEEDSASLGIPGPDDVATWALAQPDNPRAKNVLEYINRLEGKKPSTHLAHLLSALMPKFLYFGSQDKMPGRISIEDFLKNKDQNPVRRDYQLFSMFLDYAGVKSGEFNLKTAESYFARLERAQNSITRKVFKYWTQNPTLEVKFQLQPGRENDPAPFNKGTVFHTRIENRLHRMTVQFDERSYGFIWFFTFLVEFSQVRKLYPNVIILLDEPGLSLHGLAQQDLLRFIDEELSPHHQVVYTTHSPFMVPPANLERVRVVEDVVVEKDGQLQSEGTRVGSDFLKVDKDTIFPLQGALGYEITQSLFIGRNTLLVEGPSDILYIQAASRELARQGRESLNPNWIICPTSGVSKVAAFVTLFSGNRLNVAVFTDLSLGPDGNKKEIESLRRSGVLEAARIYTAADFTGQRESDVEDMWGANGYAGILNAAYALNPVLGAEDLLAAMPATSRLVKKAEDWFRSDAGRPEFDHFAPSSWLIQNPAWLTDKSVLLAEGLDRFEALFRRINPLVV